MKEKILSLIESESYRKYLMSAELSNKDLIKIIAGSRIDLMRKLELTKQLHASIKESDPENAAAAEKLIACYKRAIGRICSPPKDSVFTLVMNWNNRRDLPDPGQSSERICHNWAQVMETIDKSIHHGCYEDYAENEDDHQWNIVDSYSCRSKKMQHHSTYIVGSEGTVWSYELDNMFPAKFPENRLKKFRPDLPVDFKAGDILTIDRRPFEWVKHVLVINTNAAERFSKLVMIEADENGEIKICHNERNKTISAQYRLEKYEGELEENELVLREYQRRIRSDKDFPKKLNFYFNNNFALMPAENETPEHSADRIEKYYDEMNSIQKGIVSDVTMDDILDLYEYSSERYSLKKEHSLVYIVCNGRTDIRSKLEMLCFLAGKFPESYEDFDYIEMYRKAVELMEPEPDTGFRITRKAFLNGDIEAVPEYMDYASMSDALDKIRSNPDGDNVWYLVTRYKHHEKEIEYLVSSDGVVRKYRFIKLKYEDTAFDREHPCVLHLYDTFDDGAILEIDERPFGEHFYALVLDMGGIDYIFIKNGRIFYGCHSGGFYCDRDDFESFNSLLRTREYNGELPEDVRFLSELQKMVRADIEDDGYNINWMLYEFIVDHCGDEGVPVDKVKEKFGKYLEG